MWSKENNDCVIIPASLERVWYNRLEYDFSIGTVLVIEHIEN